MINKITNIVHIVALLIYSLIMIVVNKIKGVIKIDKHVQEEEEEEYIESFQNNNSTINNQSSIESQLNEPLYKPNDFWANNINDYNDYSIEKTSYNITLPKNYALQTENYEKENTPYDYVDFNSTDGSGVHLQGNWKVNGVARPWFESYDNNISSPTMSTTTPFQN